MTRSTLWSKIIDCFMIQIKNKDDLIKIWLHIGLKGLKSPQLWWFSGFWQKIEFYDQNKKIFWIKKFFFDQDHEVFDLQIKIKRVNFWSRSKNKTRFFGPDQKQKPSYLIQIKKNTVDFWSRSWLFMIQIMGSWTFGSITVIHDLPTVKNFNWWP